MAHMWFGDLVTMTLVAYDLWLNESFAEHMGPDVGSRSRGDPAGRRQLDRRSRCCPQGRGGR